MRIVLVDELVAYADEICVGELVTEPVPATIAMFNALHGWLTVVERSTWSLRRQRIAAVTTAADGE